jgi:hypothetical protein
MFAALRNDPGGTIAAPGKPRNPRPTAYGLAYLHFHAVRVHGDQEHHGGQAQLHSTRSGLVHRGETSAIVDDGCGTEIA